jgi:hypothetical protein
MTQYINFSTGNSYLDEALENYLMYGFEPGGFLTAVLSNNLYLAAGRADSHNRERLTEIALSVYHNMPGISFGSPEAVRNWLKDKDRRRSEYAYRKEKEYTFKVLKGEIGEKVKDYPF